MCPGLTAAGLRRARTGPPTRPPWWVGGGAEVTDTRSTVPHCGRCPAKPADACGPGLPALTRTSRFFSEGAVVAADPSFSEASACRSWRPMACGAPVAPPPRPRLSPAPRVGGTTRPRLHRAQPDRESPVDLWPDARRHRGGAHRPRKAGAAGCKGSFTWSSSGRGPPLRAWGQEAARLPLLGEQASLKVSLPFEIHLLGVFWLK